jgi:hypothetical protein
MSHPGGGTATLSVLAQRIRLPGLAADFHVPRGWPTPTDRWVRENLFWQPPHAWTPRPGLKAAPAAWRFWLPNDNWRATSSRHYRTVTVWLKASSWLGLGFLVVSTISALLGFPTGLRVLAILTVLACAVCVATHEVLRRRMTRRVLEALEAVAERERTQRLTREYQQYLRATA